MKTLLSFTGYWDPYITASVDDIEQRGPILTLLLARKIDRVILLNTPNMTRQTQETEMEILRQHPSVSVHVEELSAADPTSLSDLLTVLKGKTKEIKQRYPDDEFCVSIGSGTPQSQAAWLLLTRGGDFEAEVVEARSNPYVTREMPEVQSYEGFFADEQSVAEPGSLSVEEVARQIGLIGRDMRFRQALDTAATLARHSSPLLIRGEQGSGKALFGMLVHKLSNRSRKPLVTINCRSLSENLAESLLFGHRKGAFSGASEDYVGKFAEGDGGVLLLRDVDRLPKSVQAKLSRAIDTGEVTPMGADKAIHADVRVLATSSKELGAEADKNRFSVDLYRQLSSATITVPSLRERRSDIPLIALHVLRRINASLKDPRTFSTDCLEFLQRQEWPNNVAGLANVVERTALLARSPMITIEDLKSQMTMSGYNQRQHDLPKLEEGFSLELYMSSIRREIITNALTRSNGNQSRAAKLLGITPQAVHKFVKKMKEEGQM